jgi:hypothetical protein
MRFLDRGGDPAARTQRDLVAKLKGAVDRRVDNAVRLQTAETKLTEARSNVEALALEADDAALDRALQARRSAEDKLAALRGAALAIGKEISEIEAQIDKVVDQRCRVETSQVVTAMADRIARAQTANEATALELEAATKEGGLLIPEARAVYEFTRSFREQLPPAIEMIVGALRQHARGVVEGFAPASLPRPAAAAPVLTVVPQQEPMANVFVTRNIRYVGQGGDVICCGGNRRHDLPMKISELALASGAARPLSDRKHIEAFEGTSGMYVPTPEACEWVGKEPAPLQMRPGGTPVYHSTSPSPFTQMDRGPAFSVPISRGPEPVAVGQRNAEDD